jgi:glycosidase
VTLLGLHDVPRFMSEPGATPATLRQAFTFLLTARGTPLVYYGDEIAMAGGGDPDNRRDFPGGFPGDARSAFDAAGRTPDEQAVFARVKALLQLRRQAPALRRGATRNLHVADKAWVYARVLDGSKPAVVAFNTGDRSEDLDVAAGPAGRVDGARLADGLGSGVTATVEAGRLRLTMPPASSVVLQP